CARKANPYRVLTVSHYVRYRTQRRKSPGRARAVIPAGLSFLFLGGQRPMSAGGDRARYRVVGIRRNRTRDVRSENLTWVTAESVQVALLASRAYRHVVIEPQPKREREKNDLPQFGAPGRKWGLASISPTTAVRICCPERLAMW